MLKSMWRRGHIKGQVLEGGGGVGWLVAIIFMYIFGAKDFMRKILFFCKLLYSKKWVFGNG